MGKESHFTSKKPRVFVRGIEGHYNLKDELARLRQGRDDLSQATIRGLGASRRCV